MNTKKPKTGARRARLSPEGRAAIAAAQRKRWRAWRRAQKAKAADAE